MEHDGANDLLALSAYLGDAVPPAVPDAPPPRTRPRDDLPMSEEQAAFMVYLVSQDRARTGGHFAHIQ